jgi:hypothetical protein
VQEALVVGYPKMLNTDDDLCTDQGTLGYTLQHMYKTTALLFRPCPQERTDPLNHKSQEQGGNNLVRRRTNFTHPVMCFVSLYPRRDISLVIILGCSQPS